jgi:hypothetical protein
MSDLQMYLAIGLPILFNGTALLLLNSHVNAQLADVRSGMREIRDDMREIRGDIKLLTGKVYEMMAKHE